MGATVSNVLEKIVTMLLVIVSLVAGIIILPGRITRSHIVNISNMQHA